jgi:phosphatidylinositol alpha-1,6-mannosyltransferase
VDISLFKPTISRSEIRRKYRLHGKVVMFVGALRKQFDFDLVFKAMPLVRKEVNNVNLVIVGSGVFEKDLKNLSKKLNIEEHTTFLGFQPYKLIPSIIRAADVLVAPNRDNPMNRSRSPVKIAEYMSTGVPIVASSVGLANEMLKNGSGALCDPESPEDMANKIIEVLKNKKKSKNLSKTAKQNVVKNYSWEKLGSELNKFINKFS